jgi:hypothetical protein
VTGLDQNIELPFHLVDYVDAFPTLFRIEVDTEGRVEEVKVIFLRMRCAAC